MESSRNRGTRVFEARLCHRMNALSTFVNWEQSGRGRRLLSIEFKDNCGILCGSNALWGVKTSLQSDVHLVRKKKKKVDFNVDVACFAIHTIIGGACPLTRRMYRAARANTLYLKSIVVEGVHIEQLTNTTGSDTGKTELVGD